MKINSNTDRRLNSPAKKVAYAAMLTALAIIFGYIEFLFPVSLGVPGVKPGLANLVVLLGFTILEPLEVLAILVVRIFVSGFLFGNLFGCIYSLAGGLCSFVLMWLIYKSQKFSLLGVSIIGGVTHNMGQLLVAIIIVKNMKLLYYGPVLVICGALAGFFVGFLACQCKKYVVVNKS